MRGTKDIADGISHEYRLKILMEWLPNAQPDMGSEEMKLLFEAWFVFVEPHGIKKPECKICVNNILKNWLAMKSALIEAEQEYNALEAIN